MRESEGFKYALRVLVRISLLAGVAVVAFVIGRETRLTGRPRPSLKILPAGIRLKLLLTEIPSKSTGNQ